MRGATPRGEMQARPNATVLPGGSTIFEITAACVGCGACLRTCPERAIRARPGGLVVLATCTACGECAEICPADACQEVVR